MLCCALGIAAVATVPAWRRVLRTASGPGTVALVSFSTIAVTIVGILTAHASFHKAAGGQGMAVSHLCIAPSINTAEFRPKLSTFTPGGSS
jgi:hypothetical protein